MKVNIGPYRSWIGPYQIADIIFFWVPKYRFDGLLDPKDEPWDTRAREKFGDWLNERQWLVDLCKIGRAHV